MDFLSVSDAVCFSHLAFMKKKFLEINEEGCQLGFQIQFFFIWNTKPLQTSPLRVGEEQPLTPLQPRLVVGLVSLKDGFMPAEICCQMKAV